MLGQPLLYTPVVGYQYYIILYMSHMKSKVGKIVFRCYAFVSGRASGSNNYASSHWIFHQIPALKMLANPNTNVFDEPDINMLGKPSKPCTAWTK